ncbi:RNA polymerase sigma factor [Sphingosinicella sp. LHD-64]|uniref:RNA polymerase sigma factor n=1 Tax=Sphingosinicella sp. LHD-64 TaxID=3072139 RepID=UPI00280E7C47|nr:RNA polymerase sigma factor [Sphingosinicella sp. LHD-64]MDQ8757864.1 RNA polymerase sigma factor [Sphingosinicella sp. LHD-64]
MPLRIGSVLDVGVLPDEKSSPSAGETTERALMMHVAGGNAAAFRQLTERHTPLVHALAWRLLGDAAEAEDVVQEAFVKLWVNAKGWTPTGGGLGGWLRRVATNACLDRLRRRRFVSDEAAPERADEAPTADAMIDAERRRAAVTAAIQALPDRQRAAIVLTYHEGVSNAEAAAILGVGVKAFESLLVRARQALTRALAGEGFLGGGEGA